MPNPTERARRTIATMAQKHGFRLEDSRVADRKVSLHTLYTGGGHLVRLVDEVDIAFVQCGAHGKWLAILPLEALMEILESEALLGNLRKEPI